MLPTTFLDKTCDIYTNNITVSWGEQVISEVLLQSGVKCDFYTSKSDRLQQTDLAQRTDKEKKTLILSPLTTVRKGMTVVLTGLFNDGKYLIDNVQPMFNHRGQLDHLHCKCIARW